MTEPNIFVAGFGRCGAPGMMRAAAVQWSGHAQREVAI